MKNVSSLLVGCEELIEACKDCPEIRLPNLEERGGYVCKDKINDFCLKKTDGESCMEKIIASINC